jgi:hypothetical protein
MAGPLRGLQGIAPRSATVPVPQGTAEQTQGPSADPRHAHTTLTDIYPWQTVPAPGAQFWHAPYATDEELLGFPVFETPAGAPGQDPRADLTPVKHAAPWPTTGPRDSAPRDLTHAARVAQNSADLHASDTGASREVTYNLPEPQGHWRRFAYNSAGETNLAHGMPRQLMGSVMGVGSTDRVHGMARQNEWGFDGAHVSERYRDSRGVLNYFWMRPGGRPMTIEAHGNTNTRDGQNSPYAGTVALQQSTYSAQGAALQVQPSEYVAPPEPILAPVLPADQAVWSEW